MDKKRYLKGPQNSPVWSENALFGGTLKNIKEALV